jgi:hypothetical protein
MKKHYSFSVDFKDKSLLMKVLSYILFFVKGFMTKYITTINNVIYFPKQSDINSPGAAPILAHEIKHIQQSNNYTFVLFSLLYLFPQSLSLLSVLGFLGFIYWPLFLCFAFIIALAPFGAYWRMKFELEAYTVSLYCLNLQLSNQDEQTRRKVLQDEAVWINTQFTSSNYYWMWRSGVLDELNNKIESILDGSIEKNDSYLLQVKELF